MLGKCILITGAVLVCVVAAVHGEDVVTTQLDGATHQGALQDLTSERLVLRADSGDVTVPVEQLLQIEFAGRAAVTAQPGSVVTLTDGSEIAASRFASDGNAATVASPGFGELSPLIRQVKAVRWQALEEKLTAPWTELLARNARDDLVVFRKGDVLDYSAGSVGVITDEAVTLRVRDRDLSAPRERIFAVIFAVRGTPLTPEGPTIETVHGDRLRALPKFTGETFQLTHAALGELKIPGPTLWRLNYGSGRMRALADVPFDDSGSKPPAADRPVVWYWSRNAPAGSGGQSPLIVGGQEYRRGLWLHSGAQLRFGLNRESTRLRALAGFEQTHVTRMPRFDPQVRLVILGDQRELFSQEFHWDAAPVPLDLDLTDIRELIIRVESQGAQHGVLEHFALVDAQVLQ